MFKKLHVKNDQEKRTLCEPIREGKERKEIKQIYCSDEEKCNLDLERIFNCYF